ncbi:MAG: CHAT domain-containing protein [Ignavibacteriaceae bacterium]
MHLRIYSILILIFTSLSVQPDAVKTDQSTDTIVNFPANFNKIDSLRSIIKSAGWNSALLADYHFYIVNHAVNPEKELSELKNLPDGFQKNLIKAIIYKRQNQFVKMYESLQYLPEDKPDYLPFYEELVFAARATGRIALLQAKTETLSNKNPDKFDLFVLALINSTRGNYNDALELISEAVEMDSSNPVLLYHLSYVFRYLGDYQKALESLDSALKYSEDKWFNGRCTLALGSLFYLSGDYDKAIGFYNQGYLSALSIKDHQTEATALVNLGIMEDLQGNIDKARENFLSAAEIASNINDQETEAFAYSELGVSYSFTNNVIEAKKYYLLSYGLYENTGNKQRLCLLAVNLGKIYLNLFNYKTALNYYRQGLEFAGENKRAKILNITGLGDVYSNLSNYSLALQYYNQAKEIASKINEISLQAEIESGLGMLNFNIGRYPGAIEYFNEALQSALKGEDPYLQADIFHNAGMAYIAADSIDKGIEYLNSAISLAEHYQSVYTLAYSLTDLAAALIKQKQFSEARDKLQQSEKIADQYDLDYILALNSLTKASLYQQSGKFQKAIDELMECKKNAEKINEPNLAIEAEFRLGRLYSNLRLNELALSHFRNALNLIEEYSFMLFPEKDVQIFYLSSYQKIYNACTDLLLSGKKFEEAFEMIERSRSRNLMQTLNRIKLQSEIGDENILEKIFDYRWIIKSGLYDDNFTDSIKAELILLEDSIIGQDSTLKKYLTSIPDPEIEKIQQQLSEDETIIDIYSNENSTYVFMLNKDIFHAQEIKIGREELLNKITNVSPYFTSLTSDEEVYYNQDLFSFNSEAAYELYYILLKSTVSKIKKNSKLIFISGPELAAFPFEFLCTGFDTGSSPYEYQNQDFLVYDYSISYAPSVLNFTEVKNNRLKNTGKSLVIGDPVVNTKRKGYAERRGLLEESPGISRNISLLPLQYSEDEVTRVADLIGAEKVLLNTNATESNFKQNAELSKIIHLSTHSFLFNKQPVILLSNSADQYNDGFLEMSEIVNLNLNSDLVVLSSCKSGLGMISKSEGIIGMSKAFFESGSKSIVVSLWEVSDRYTTEFMVLFYNKLSQGYNKSEAMQKAKIEFIRKHSANPYLWAGFVLVGDVSELKIDHPISMGKYVAGLIFIFLLSLIMIYIVRKKIIAPNSAS